MQKQDEHHGCCAAPGSLPRYRMPDRRRFLTLATLAAGVSLLAPVTLRRASADNANILLLSCMDYRLTSEVSAYMESRNLRHQYDHIILAGASLGVVTQLKPNWNSEFWDHVTVAKDLHHIKKLMVLDHRDCGAYKVFLGQDYGKDRELETKVHAETLRKMAGLVKERHADLEIELLLMSLDGTVENISLTA